MFMQPFGPADLSGLGWLCSCVRVGLQLAWRCGAGPRACLKIRAPPPLKSNPKTAQTSLLIQLQPTSKPKSSPQPSQSPRPDASPKQWFSGVQASGRGGLNIRAAKDEPGAWQKSKSESADQSMWPAMFLSVFEVAPLVSCCTCKRKHWDRPAKFQVLRCMSTCLKSECMNPSMNPCYLHC